jgi:hypothetical protein
MTSWRETASTQAQADLDVLLNEVLPRAHALLVRQGGFFPFGATLSTASEVQITPSPPARPKPPPASELLDAMYASARRRADDLRAAAFVADVRAGTRDAVAVQLEHCERLSIGVLLAYRRNALTRRVKLGQMLATTGTPRVWPDPPYSATGGG